MKANNWCLAIAALSASALAFAQGPDMTFTNSDGSVLTIYSFTPSGTAPMNVSGSYLDNTGLGGCQKGKAYEVNLTVTGDPANSTVSFKSALCSGVKLSFSGTFTGMPSGPMPPPPGDNGGLPVLSITASLDVSSSTKSTFDANM